MTKGDPADQRAAVVRALDAGVTYFDTAAMYGNGTSEQNIGRVLTELGAWDRVTLGTKLRLRASDLSDIPGSVQRCLRESLSRLGRDSVDLFQLHNRLAAETNADGDTLGTAHLDAVAAAMRDLVTAGHVRFIGITGLGETPVLRRTIESGAFDTVQTYFNALNPSYGYAGATAGAQDFEGLIDTAAQRGMGSIGIRVMAAGAMAGTTERAPLAGGGGPPLAGNQGFEDDVKQAQAMESLAKELGLESALELALRFAIAKPTLSTALVGFSDMAQLESSLRWAERGPLSADAVERVLAVARR
jgi:aryl-alcohol dehydrogenase-like predicted oxidoreductase